MKRIFSSLLTLLILITFSVASDTDRGKDIKQLNIGKPCCSNCDEKKVEKTNKPSCPNCAESKKPCCKDG